MIISQISGPGYVVFISGVFTMYVPSLDLSKKKPYNKVLFRKMKHIQRLSHVKQIIDVLII